MGTLSEVRPSGITRVCVSRKLRSDLGGIVSAACRSRTAFSTTRAGAAPETSPTWTTRRQVARKATAPTPRRSMTCTGISLRANERRFQYSSLEKNGCGGPQPRDSRGGDRNGGLRPRGGLTLAWRGSRPSVALLRVASPIRAGRGHDGGAHGPPVVSGAPAPGAPICPSRSALRSGARHPLRVAGQVPHGGPRPRVRAASTGLLPGRTFVSSAHDKLGAPSESTRRDLVDLYHVAPERVRVVPLGDGERGEREAAPAKRLAELGLAGDFVLQVGRVEARKNQSAALAAVERLD